MKHYFTKDYVPTLELAAGKVLTTAATILQYVSQRKLESRLVPAAGTIGRYRTLAWLNFAATEIYKTLGVLFKSNMNGAWRPASGQPIRPPVGHIDVVLRTRPNLDNKRFGVADTFLAMPDWTALFDIGLG